MISTVEIESAIRQFQGIEEQRTVNKGIIPLAKELNLPLVATNDVHYLRDTDAHPHDVLLCIGTGKGFNDPKRLRYEAKQFFLKTADDMAATFKDYPEAIANTVKIAERCNVKLGSGENYLPDFDVPPAISKTAHGVKQGNVTRAPSLRRFLTGSPKKRAHPVAEVVIGF